MIPHSRTLLRDDVIRAARTVTLTGHVSQGPWVDQFEQQIARFLGGRVRTGGLPGVPWPRPRTQPYQEGQNLPEWAGVAVNSGTTALTLALSGLRVGPGDEVIVPSYVCAAVRNAVRQTGAVEVVADIEEGGFNLCPADTRRRITRRTRAIVVTHLFGQIADLRGLLELGPPVVEDCAQAIGAVYGSRPVGSFGLAAVLSFYATKLLTTGEGGMALSGDPRLAARMRDLRDYDNREDERVRFNGKMTDLQAALGCAQWLRLPSFLERRRRLARRLDDTLEGCGVALPSPRPGSVCYRYVVRLPDTPDAAYRRDRALAELQSRGIEAKRPVFKPLHAHTGDDCPNADAAYRTAISLPLYPALHDEEVECVARGAREVLEAISA